MIVVLRVPQGGCRPVFFIEIDAAIFAPVGLSDRGTDRGKSAPVVQKSPYGEKSTGAPGQTAPGLPILSGQNRGNACSPAAPVLTALTGSDVVDHSPPQVTFRDRRDPSTIREEIAETRLVIAEKAHDVAELDSHLAPGRAEAAAIRDAILATQRHDDIGEGRRVVAIDFGRAGDRKPLFVALDANSAAWGPMRKWRAEAAREVKDLERHLERLNKDLARMAKRQKRSA